MKVITQAPPLKAVGPYSLAREQSGILYCSGQIGINDGHLVDGGVSEEFRQIMLNIETLLTQAGYTVQDIFKVSIFVTDINSFSEINNLYAQHFKEPYPVRTFMQVAGLPLGAHIEIEVQATK